MMLLNELDRAISKVNEILIMGPCTLGRKLGSDIIGVRIATWFHLRDTSSRKRQCQLYQKRSQTSYPFTPQRLNHLKAYHVTGKRI